MTTTLVEEATSGIPAFLPGEGVSPSSGVARRVMAGTTALGTGVLIERGAGFLANILAARFAGAPVFGAYSLAISTANNISTYAAGGIGATATRFSGKYPYGSAGYSTLARALAIVSLVSASVAAVALWLGAGPIARLLQKGSVTGLLRWSAASVAGIILLECARGFFVGQRRLAAVVLLSLLIAIGMLCLLPYTASRHNANHMIFAQGAVTLAAVLVCLLLARPLGLLAPHSARTTRELLPMLREVWTFGGVQLAGLVGANLSGWWITALVARSDKTLVQMSFFAIASQLRNLTGLAPGLLTEGSYAVMADPEHEHLRTPQRVMAICSFASTGLTLLVASAGILVVPAALLHLYGPSYRGAALAACLGLATAVVHMGNAPAAARLSIVSIRATGVINSVWAAAVALAGTLLLLRSGSAALAMFIFFGAHVLSAALVLGVLARKDYLPAGVPTLFALSTGSVVLLAMLSLLRVRAQLTPLLTIVGIALVSCSSAALFIFLGRRHSWLPRAATLRSLRLKLKTFLQRFTQKMTERTSHGA